MVKLTGIPRDPFPRLLAALHDAALDGALWPAALRLIDEACGVTGGSVLVDRGDGGDGRLPFAGFYRRGERRRDLERDYYRNYYHLDERVPRVLRLRRGKLVRAASLYSAEELRTSPTWNEALPRSGTRNGLLVRLPELRGLRVTWVIADPVAGAWESAQIRMIRRLMPHLRNFVDVRQSLAGAGALGASLVQLLGNARLGVIHVDRNGRIVEANDRARITLGENHGLRQQDGTLRAWLPGDDARLRRLLASALPAFDAPPAAGSMQVKHPFGGPALTLHVHPVTVRQLDFGAPDAGALVLIDSRDRTLGIDADLIASALGLTAAESRVSLWLAEGKTVPDIAVLSARAESSVRTHLKRIHRKLGVSRRADLVRLVLSVPQSNGITQRP